MPKFTDIWSNSRQINLQGIFPMVRGIFRILFDHKCMYAFFVFFWGMNAYISLLISMHEHPNFSYRTSTSPLPALTVDALLLQSKLTSCHSSCIVVPRLSLSVSLERLYRGKRGKTAPTEWNTDWESWQKHAMTVFHIATESWHSREVGLTDFEVRQPDWRRKALGARCHSILTPLDLDSIFGVRNRARNLFSS